MTEWSELAKVNMADGADDEKVMKTTVTLTGTIQSGDQVIDGEAITLGDVVGYEPHNIKRTWCERLFTWPWKPWVKTRVIAAPVFEATRTLKDD